MSKQQRRKGNAKNASSAAAHGYLAQGGATLVGLTPEMNIFEVASSNMLHHMAEIDDEARIVMKKLTKKDPLTREKGLKELMELIISEKTSVENCYEHFCGLVAPLTTDGSPCVRMLTMKTISLFLAKLKKAASKGLKKVIPMVLFAKSDVTNGAAAAASAVIRDGFDADKKLQIIQLFGPATFEIAAKMALAQHELCYLTEYDGLEDKETRKSRLEAQSLNVFLSFIKEFGNETKIWEEHAKKLFENTEYIKKTFTGNKESLKVQLLNICYNFSENVEVLLGLPAVVPYIQSTLDAQTFTPECATAWEGLILLMENEQFQCKVSLQKGIYPRILNVVRKKGNHWRVLKNYLLPAVVVLLEQLKDSDENQKMLASIMESFTDNVPFSGDVSSNAIHCWFHTFADFVRWVVTNDRADKEFMLAIFRLVCKMSEQAMIVGTSDAIECISGLCFWFVNKKKETDDLLAKQLCRFIENQIFASGAKSELLRNALTSSKDLIQFAELHAHLLNDPELNDFNLMRNLARSSDEYFDCTLALITNFNFIETTEKFEAAQSTDIVNLILRILHKNKKLSIKVQNNCVGRQLLLSKDSLIWEKVLKTVAVGVFQEMVDYWHQHRNGRAIAEAVKFLEKNGVPLDTNAAAENVDFLITLLQSSESTSEEKKPFVQKLFVALFESDDEPKQDHYENLKNHLNADFDSDGFFNKMFESSEEFEVERVLDTAGRLNKLIGLCAEELRVKVSENLLTSRSEYESMTEKLHFLEVDVLTYSTNATIITEAFTRPSEQLNEKEANEFVKICGRKALFSLASKYHTTIHEMLGWQMIRVIQALEDRYCLKPLDEELAYIKEQLEARAKKTDDVKNQILESKCPNFLADVFGLTFEQERQSASFKTTEDVETLTNKIETLFSDCLALKYMETVFEATQSDHSFALFQFDFESQYEWLANLAFAKKFLQCGGEIFATENSELRDFALCGVVTVLDNSIDIISESVDGLLSDPRLEALTTIYMEVFLTLTNAANGSEYPEQSVEEWNEFYAPTIRTYFIRMFRSVQKDQQPTPFIRTLYKALLSISEFPSEVPSDDVKEFVPELSVFKYPQFQESCISQAFSLLTSNVEHVQLIGYVVAKLLMPIMLKQEMTGDPKTVQLPVMIQKTTTSHCSHPHVNILLLDICLSPFESDVFDRVSYIEAVTEFFRNSLDFLLVDQPFDFNRSPFSCRIPRGQERDYYLTSDSSASPVFFDKLASRVLFKMITHLPATVRVYHKNKSNRFGPMFTEAVTKYASKLLIEQEMIKVREKEFSGELKVRTVPVAGEVVAEYVIDENKMRLFFVLPQDYPLTVPTLWLDKAIVKSDRAQKWLFQLTAFVFHQNGSIVEGIEMFKKIVDKGVDGAEDCTICMMTVHPQTHQLPKVKCKQCKNKFHSNCLYKWFESSNQATCPLCRNHFT